MSQNSTYIEYIYNSRKNILDLLKEQNYNVDDYTNASVNEVHLMVQNKQQDMLLSNDDDDRKVYVKYHLGKTLRQNNIYEMLEDLFEVENILTKRDDLIIIMKDQPNDTIIKLLKDIHEKDGYFIIIFNIQKLQFNILNHSYVPKHRILSEEEEIDIKKLYNISSNKQLPEISRFDPVAQAIGIRPGEICEIIRPSKTAITSKFYRICS